MESMPEKKKMRNNWRRAHSRTTKMIGP